MQEISTRQFIEERRKDIQSIKNNNLSKWRQAVDQLRHQNILSDDKSAELLLSGWKQASQDSSKGPSREEANDINIVRQNEEDLRKKSPKKPKASPQRSLGRSLCRPEKNPGVSDVQKMIFDKKFKNYLNHKQEYQERARENRERLLERRKRGQTTTVDVMVLGESDSLSDADHKFRNGEDMMAAYERVATGKKGNSKQPLLYQPQTFELSFRKREFELILMRTKENSSIPKEELFEYLFEEPFIMMLYSINPYLVADELAELETKEDGLLNFIQFSNYLLTDRQPSYFQYSAQVLEDAKRVGRGIKSGPIVGNWINETGVYEHLLATYDSADILGDGKVQRRYLAKRLRKECDKYDLLDRSVIQIVNINKEITVDRLLYEIEYQQRQSQIWSREEFVKYLQNYYRLTTPEKDHLLGRLIPSGAYDSSYVFIVPQEVLDAIKSIFNNFRHMAGYFVKTSSFLETIIADQRYNRIRRMIVRPQANKYVKQETVEQTLARMAMEANQYSDMEELLDFFTSRGRPRSIEYQVYLCNLEQQLQNAESSVDKEGEDDSSDEEVDRQLRLKAYARKMSRLKEIKNLNVFSQEKVADVTIPQAFGFDNRDRAKRMSIRQRKLKEMLKEKLAKEEEQMKPLPAKEVPRHVKQNLYERMVEEGEKQRKKRLERFRQEIMANAVPVSDRLIKKRAFTQTAASEYKFTARPMPWYCEVNLLQRIQNQKLQRRERILEQIINKHNQFDLPDGVLRMMDRQAALQEKNKHNRTVSTRSIGECTFVPKITQKVPDFATLHEHLQFDLNNAKEVKQPVHVKPFSFENRPSRSKTTTITKTVEARKPSYSKVERSQQIEIPKTKKYEALVQLRMKQEQQRLHKLQMERKSSTIRRMRQEKFAPIVQAALRNSEHDPSKSRAIIEQKIKQFKRQQKRKKAEYEQQMIRIYTKVINRPLLIESDQKQGPQRQSRLKKDQQGAEYLEDYKPKLVEVNRRSYDDYEQLRQKAVVEHRPGHYQLDGGALEEDDQRDYDDNLGKYTS